MGKHKNRKYYGKEKEISRKIGNRAMDYGKGTVESKVKWPMHENPMKTQYIVC